jgi:ADP-ribose pyrophosphatase YjhB (NUDIX family)
LSSTSTTRKSRSVERHVSAGGVVYRANTNSKQIEIVLCGRTTPPLWGLPKGTPNPGETYQQTALREVKEETGLEVEIEAPVGSIDYWFQRDGVRIHKTVHFYLMRPTGGHENLHDPEFDVVRWFPIEEGLLFLTHANEVEIVKRAWNIMKERVP